MSHAVSAFRQACLADRLVRCQAGVTTGVRRYCSSALERIDAAIIGAGVVGLAVARSLALAGREVLVLDSASAIGTETSSRNSEIIHAGIYYPPGSLKATLCMKGRSMLYDYCREHDVPHKAVGKLLVATDEAQVEKLHNLEDNGRKNGVSDLRRISVREAKDLEPNLHCCAALLSPSTGIVDSHSLMLAYQADIESHGGATICHSSVDAGMLNDGERWLDIKDSSDGTVVRLVPELVVNAAGLHAQDVAQRLQGLPQDKVPRRHLARGCYFSLAGPPPFHHLIYPLPEEGGLGVHLTVDLSGQVKFGPDVEWVDSIDYTVDPHRADRFYGAIRQYYPALQDNVLQPSYSGIRPKVSGPGEPNADFIIQGPTDHGVKGLVNLFGIESPGLTASLAIGESVKNIVLSE